MQHKGTFSLTHNHAHITHAKAHIHVHVHTCTHTCTHTHTHTHTHKRCIISEMTEPLRYAEELRVQMVNLKCSYPMKLAHAINTAITIYCHAPSVCSSNITRILKRARHKGAECMCNHLATGQTSLFPPKPQPYNLLKSSTPAKICAFWRKTADFNTLTAKRTELVIH